MPPKKPPANKPNKKTELKKKEKVIEDKTFGLKNKKGNKQQKFIAQVEKQVKSSGDPKTRNLEKERLDEKKRKEEAKRIEEEQKALYRPVTTQKVDAGVDPKSVFCAFFKQGLCKKGEKCKFSHDPSVENKSAKKSIYSDGKEEEEKGMEDWDEDMLAYVVNKKHSAEASNKTAIICKYFLDALENNKYGWFWACPNNGKDCIYKHALPSGFVLKKDKKREEKKEEISIEELIEQKRAELSSRMDLTKVTIETFIAWKKRKLKEKSLLEKKENEKKKKGYQSGNMIGLSGREMFSFDPSMAGDGSDDEEGGEAVDFSKIESDETETDNVKVHEIKFDQYGVMIDGLDETTDEQLAKLNGASGPIDEDLFEDEDLDELEEEFETLEV
uniref:Zinc finger CCCH domain-containing protein 15 homolog n=1 Tax=Caligus rogercresseyi TaxID=217165 RepID=C1BQ27_CALRO|nr:Zinc finger CCCH domain-containing protein 15 homolog [Caligus rogercresseyi]|eukprot:TRINITY_DN5095_c0_g1_i1.p2 TRINITY_DN5095_c0_g1~~TRINITY_DN5095_c0_g1_i1.p2  ORF type:complete len:386 (-),score=166.99 TRINITY_DN5095_c0_g1_i1:111-1268(-)